MRADGPRYETYALLREAVETHIERGEGAVVKNDFLKGIGHGIVY
jgi:hypothetical protein